MSGLFTPAWAAALERELGNDEEYRRAASSWRGSLALVLEPAPELGYPAERSLFLDLLHGNPRAVRPALPGDLERAAFRLTGAAAVWHDLLEGRLEAATAITGGRLRLTRGSLFQLLPHLAAARALLHCARRVGAGTAAAAE